MTLDESFNNSARNKHFSLGLAYHYRKIMLSDSKSSGSSKNPASISKSNSSNAVSSNKPNISTSNRSSAVEKTATIDDIIEKPKPVFVLPTTNSSSSSSSAVIAAIASSNNNSSASSNNKINSIRSSSASNSIKSSCASNSSNNSSVNSNTYFLDRKSQVAPDSSMIPIPDFGDAFDEGTEEQFE